MVRVIHTIAGLSSNSGGPSRTVPGLCEALAKRGVSVELISHDASNNQQKSLLPHVDLVRTTLVSAVGQSKWCAIFSSEFEKKLKKICSEVKAQIIHDHGIWLPSNHYAAVVAYRLKIPFVVSTRGMLEPWALSFRALKKRIALALYQKNDLMSASLFHATSLLEASSIRKAGLYQPIAVIPNGIYLPQMIPKSKQTGSSHKALFLSRIHPKKGLLNLVSAWSIVRPKGWKVIIAGPDEENHRQEVQRAIEKEQLQNDFKFVGQVQGQAKWELYQDADLFILPTFSENFGIVVAEALGCGVPVITTKGAPWEGLVTHQCGWWVDIGVQPLVEAIHEATSISDEERKEMGRQGRLYVEQNFAWPKIAEQMLSVYEWVLGMGGMPECVVIR